MNIFHLSRVSVCLINGASVSACFVGTNLSAAEIDAAARLGLIVTLFEPATAFEFVTESYRHVDQVVSLVVIDSVDMANQMHDDRDELVAQASEDPKGAWGVSLNGQRTARRFRDSAAAVAMINTFHRRGQIAQLIEVHEDDADSALMENIADKDQ